jgi:hypothetical protein
MLLLKSNSSFDTFTSRQILIIMAIVFIIIPEYGSKVYDRFFFITVFKIDKINTFTTREKLWSLPIVNIHISSNFSNVVSFILFFNAIFPNYDMCSTILKLKLNIFLTIVKRIYIAAISRKFYFTLMIPVLILFKNFFIIFYVSFISCWNPYNILSFNSLSSFETCILQMKVIEDAICSIIDVSMNKIIICLDKVK